MKKQTYLLMQQALQLSAVVAAVVAATLIFAVLSKALNPRAREAYNDEEQIEEMRQYQKSQENTNIVYY